jgi:hypothetical protein
VIDTANAGPRGLRRAGASLLCITVSARLAGCAAAPSPLTPSSGITAQTSSADSFPSPAKAPSYDGCPVFPRSSSAYNEDISQKPIDRKSSAYIASLRGFTTGWDNDYAEFLNTADGSTPVLRVKQEVSYHSMVPEPWTPSFLIENEPDGHSFVLDVSSCHLYELYSTQYAITTNTLAAYSGGNWDLRMRYVPQKPDSPSAVASGISMFAGAVKYEELAAGKVTHALFLIAPQNSLSQWNFVRPASDTGQVPYEGSGGVQLPYGAKLRLRFNYPTTGLGPQARTVVEALKHYGAIVGDTGGAWKFIYMNDLSTPNAFDYEDLAKLNAIQPTDWVVPQLPKTQTIHH